VSDQTDNNSTQTELPNDGADKPQTLDPEPGCTKEDIKLMQLIAGPAPGKEDEYAELFEAQTEETKRTIRARQEKIMSETPWGLSQTGLCDRSQLGRTDRRQLA
jgi:hypothetical protein